MTGPIVSSLVRDAVLFLSVSLIAFLIAVALSRKITNPIGELRTYAASLGKGEAPKEVDVENVPELQDLAESLNAMAEKMHERETALRESEERYRALVESAPDAVLVHRDGLFLYANSKALNLYGAETLKQLQCRKVLDLIHPDDQPAIAERMHRGMAGQSLELRETKLVRLDGQVVPVESVGEVITYQGSPAVQVIVRNITTRKQAEQQLALDLDAMTRLQKLGSLFVNEGSLGPMMTEIVDAAVEIAGADFGNIQLIDPASGDLRIAAHRGFPQWWLDFWDSVAKGRGSCGTALERGERVIVEDVEQSPIFIGTPALDIQRKAGVRSVQSTPLLSRSGKPVGMFSTHHRTPRRPTDRELRLLDLLARQAADIIEHAQAEEELHESEGRFRSVLESTADVVYRWNMRSGRFDYVSPSVEKVFGYTPDEIMVMSRAEALSLIHPDDVPVYRAAIVHLEETGMAEAEYRQRARGGEYRWLSNRMTFARDAAGNSLYRHGSIRDITERKRAEEALQASEQKYRSLFENIEEMVTVYEVERNADGRIVERRLRDANRTFLRTVGESSIDKIRGKTSSQIFGKVWPEVHLPAVQKAMDSGQVQVQEVYNADSGRHYITSIVRLDAQTYLGTGWDITERKLAEEKLRLSEEALRKANEHLEQRVRERTTELQELTEQLEKSRHELRKLASELVISEERERKRIAGVLHDEIAQNLAAARLRFDLLQRMPSDQNDKQTLQDVKKFLLQSIQETRALMSDLGNPLLFELGLKSACEALGKRFMERHPIRIICDIRDEYKNLDQDIKAVLFQVTRELLNNVVKHSQAENAHVLIDAENGQFRVKVTDDGVGFEPRAIGVPSDEGGFGLYSIRERLTAMDGSLNIVSAPGTGTVVTAILPETLD